MRYDPMVTYTPAEVFHLIKILDYEGLLVLSQLLQEEKKLYCLEDLRMISQRLTARFESEKNKRK